MTALLSVDKALENILAAVKKLAPETVSLSESLDRIIAQDVFSTIDLPPFANSAMDGYAIHHGDSDNADPDDPCALPVVMDIMAGSAPDGILSKGQAARIMTGAPVPQGATAVVAVEDTDDNWQKGEASQPPSTVCIHKRLEAGENIRLAGENIASGAIVMTAGTVIRPAELGMLAGIGCAQVPVIRKPKVAILSSGDELVDVYHELEAGKIRDTNSYTLAGLIRQAGGLPLRLPIAGDSLESIRALYRRALEINPDLLISTAGVSVGAADLVKVVMDELGDIDFWRINMRPGKPLAFGKIQGVPFFGLPGNPVSTMVTFEVLVRPALARIAGRPFKRPTVTATTSADMRSDGRRSYNRVTLSRENDTIVATSTGIQSSGALMSMVLADGLAVIPEDVTLLPSGSQVKVLVLRPIQ